MLWTEQYRPATLDEIIGQPKFYIDAITWKEGMPNLLLYGDAGTGKTAAAIATANFVLGEDKQGNFFEINASDDRRLEVVRTTIKEISSSMKLGDIPHKIILLDEMDGMTPDAQNALKRVMERYSGNVRFIITCNNRFKIILPLQSRCANYLFTKISEEDMKIVLESILEKEGIDSIPTEELEMFIKEMRGDLRRAITELQASANSNASLNIQIKRMEEPYDNILESIRNKQYESALNQIHALIHQSVDIKYVCQSLHEAILRKELDAGMKFKLLRVIGEAEWRSSNMTPKVLSSWMIGQMI
jgi:replication factor C small subunit